eukprot:gene9322-12559_t
MQCRCGNNAIIKKATKNGPNYNREFFNCPNEYGSSTNCGFICWVGESIPPSLSNSNFANNNFIKNTVNKVKQKNNPNSKECKIILVDFDLNQKFAKIWFGLTLAPLPNNVWKYFESIPTTLRRFNSKINLWTFDFKIYDSFISHLISEFDTIIVIELPKFLIRGLKSYLLKLSTDNNNSDNADNSMDQEGKSFINNEIELNIESNLVEQLLPFQLDGIRFVVKHGGRALIGDEMGCGKTIQAIGILQHYRHLWPAMIVLPPNLIDQWRLELLKFSPTILDVKDICIIKTAKDTAKGKICFVPYTLIDKLVDNERITPDQFGIVLADESHNLKAMNTRKTSATLPFLKQASVSVCLSGTPATNRPIELYPQLHGLLPNVFNDFDQFALRYCDAKPSIYTNKLEGKGSSNEKELKLLLENMVMIRRLKADVIQGIPEKSRELKYVDPDPKYLPEVERIRKRDAELTNKLKSLGSDKNDEALAINLEKRTLLNMSYQVAGMCKIGSIRDTLIQLVEELRNEKMKSITQHTNSNNNIIDSSENKINNDLNNDINNYYNNSSSMVHDSDALSHSNSKVLMELEDDGILFNDKNPVDAMINPAKPENKKIKEIIYIPSDDDDIVDSDNDMKIKNKNILFNNNNDNNNRLKPNANKRLKKSALLNSTHDESLLHIFDNNNNDNNSNDENDDYLSFNLTKIKQSVKKRSLNNSNNNNNNNKSLNDEVNFDDDELFESEALIERANLVRTKKQSKIKTKTKINNNNNIPIKEKPIYHGLGKKLIVFVHHHEVLDAIEDCLKELQVDYVRIDGKTTSNQKINLIQKFQEDDQTDVALLGITSCGTGLNLTRANIALFGELYWSPGVVLQAEDRIHRLGQTSSKVRIIYLIARNTADDIVWEQIQKKHNVLGATVGIADRSKGGYGMNINIRGSSNGANNDNDKQSQSTIDNYMRSQPPPLQLENNGYNKNDHKCIVDMTEESSDNYNYSNDNSNLNDYKYNNNNNNNNNNNISNNELLKVVNNNYYKNYKLFSLNNNDDSKIISQLSHSENLHNFHESACASIQPIKISSVYKESLGIVDNVNTIDNNINATYPNCSTTTSFKSNNSPLQNNITFLSNSTQLQPLKLSDNNNYHQNKTV